MNTSRKSKQRIQGFKRQILFFIQIQTMPQLIYLLKLLNRLMIQETESNNYLSPRVHYLKRKVLKDEPVMFGKSIFNQSQNVPIDNMLNLQQLKQYQTLTTAVDNTITLNTNPQETISVLQKSQKAEKSHLFPKLNLALQSKLSKSKSTIKPQQFKVRQKTFSLKNCYPYHIQLQQTAAKRVNKKFKQYKRAWMDSCYRKQQSVLERSLNKAALSIENINKDANKRKNTTHLSQMLRNNITEKTFIFPGRLRPELEGLKGKGGKVIPLFSEMYMIEQVYKFNKKGSRIVE